MKQSYIQIVFIDMSNIPFAAGDLHTSSNHLERFSASDLFSQNHHRAARKIRE